MNSQLAAIRKDLGLSSDSQDSWKKAFETKNHTFFKELTNAMKSLRKTLIKEKYDRETKDTVL